MINLTYALEAASALPADALTRLKADHRSKVSSRLESYGSHEASIFTQSLEPLIGPMATPVAGLCTQAAIRRCLPTLQV